MRGRAQNVARRKRAWIRKTQGLLDQSSSNFYQIVECQLTERRKGMPFIFADPR